MSVSDLAATIERVLMHVRRSREVLVAAADGAQNARDLWLPQFAGSFTEVVDLAATVEQTRLNIEEAQATLTVAEQLLHDYMASLGANPRPAPHASPKPPAAPTAVAEPQPDSAALRETAKRVRAARQRVGRREDGTAAVGEWVRSDGWAVRITSGPGDEHFHPAREFLTQHLPRPASRLATHIEIKVAARMRKDGLGDETVVIDRGVCGTRPFDAQRQYTCDKYLPAVLPPGAVLRVVQPDGTIREYEGKADA